MKETFTIDVTGFAIAFLRQVSNKSAGVGQLTNANSSQVELMFDLKEAYDTFTNAFGSHTHEYKGFETTTITIDGVECDLVIITKEDAAKVAEEIKHSKYDEQSLIKILFDLNVIYRLYQEGTIDSAKTGEIIEICISLRKHCWAKSLARIKSSINNKNHVIYDVVIPEGKEDIVFIDTMYSIKRDLMTSLKLTFDNAILPRTVEYNEEDISKFAAVKLTNDKGLIESLSKLKLYYNDITGNHRAIMNTINDEDEDSKRAEKEEYNRRIKSLTSMIRKMTSGLDPVDAVTILKYVSMSDRNSKGLRKDGGSAFASVVMPNEYVQMVMKLWGGNDFAGYEIINPKCVAGDVINFNYGVSDAGIIKSAYTGELEIVDINGKLYAGRKISETMPVSKDTSMAVLRIKDSSFKGKVGQIMTELENAKVTVNTCMKTINGNKLFEYNLSKDGKVICEIDTQGKVFNNTINGAIGEIDCVTTITTKDENDKEYSRMYVFLKNMVWSDNATIEESPEVVEDWSDVEEVEMNY
jgi:hypothetical protein